MANGAHGGLVAHPASGLSVLGSAESVRRMQRGQQVGGLWPGDGLLDVAITEEGIGYGEHETHRSLSLSYRGMRCQGPTGVDQT
jgi:hypothetical protein